MTGKDYFKQVQADIKELDFIDVRLQALERYSTGDVAAGNKAVSQRLKEKQEAIFNRLSITRMIISFIGDETNEEVAQVLDLKYLQGKSYKQISDELGITTYQVRANLDTAFNSWNNTKWVEATQVA